MKVQYIADLLYNHECVIVPGLGGFLSSYVPSRITPGSNRFYPPSCKIAFNASLSANDGILANHIAKASGITYKQASDEIRKWVDKSFKLLHSGERLQLESIGYLSLNAEGNLQFEPELKENFLGNSFGLPSFYAKAVTRKGDPITQKDVQRIKGWPSNLKYLVPETLKWAAVLAPFIALTLWGSFNSGKINNYVQNYSGMFSWVRTTPGKTSTSPSNTFILPVAKANSAKVQSPSGILKELSVSYCPSSLSYSAIRATGPLSPDKALIQSVDVNFSETNYYIIGGAFREHANALKLIEELKSKGYPASIIDTTSGGMYVVSIKGFDSRSNAFQELTAIKNAGYSSAWIKHKG
jgi:hypothetical protein